MIKAVLLDLDDTLLRNPAAPFIHGYIGRMIEYLHHAYPHLSAQRLGEALLMATRQVVHDLEPTTTNISVFYDHFTAITKINRSALPDVFQSFIKDQYHELQLLTSPVAEARDIVDWLHSQGYGVAVATNPLFPTAAVAQRLEWAGFSVDDFQFVSTMENVHFTKPNPHYYEEILTRLGFEPDEALMIGDDWENDIVPAWQAGLNTFWLSADDYPTDDARPDASGSLATLWHLLTEAGWLESLQPRPLFPKQVAPRMLGNVAALVGITEHIPDHYWHQRPDADEWSPLEIVVHLRDSERYVQRDRLRMILTQDNPFLVPPATPPAPGVQDLVGIDGMAVVIEFAAERKQTLELIEDFSNEDWTRPARHSVFGPTSLLEMAAFTARHDRLHINQLCQTVGKCD